VSADPVVAHRVIVRDRAEMERALGTAAASRLPVSLVSAPGAAAMAGPAFFLAAFAQALATVPGVAAGLVIDCGDDPGMALAALRAGARHIRVALPPHLLQRVQSAAASLGARVEFWTDVEKL